MYHGIIVEKSLIGGVSSENLFKVLKFTIDKKTHWVVKLVETPKTNILKKIASLQDIMDEGVWYNYFYDDKETLIVVFKNRAFKVSKNRSSWDEIIEYGRSLHMIKENLGFNPINFSEEEEYFKL